MNATDAVWRRLNSTRESNPSPPMARRITTADLEAYLDEVLSAADMTAVESAIRANPDLLKQLAVINGRRDAGLHSVGEIWRRHRLSCPTREQLGSYLLGVLDGEQGDYIAFHLEKIACRLCQANLDDLRRHQQESGDVVQTRRTKYFQSTAGHLRRES
jgi:hypothetical protein